MSPYNKVLSEALRMRPKERARLAEQVLASLEETPVNAEVDRAWRREIRLRVEAEDRGEVTFVPWSKVKARLKRYMR